MNARRHTTFLPDAAEIIGTPYFAAELAHEAVRLEAHKREAQRNSGVCWSGTSAEDPFGARTIREMVQAADAKRQQAERFAKNPRGVFLSALAKIRQETPEHAEATWRAQDAFSRGFADIDGPVSVGEIACAQIALSHVLTTRAAEALDALSELILKEAA